MPSTSPGARAPHARVDGDVLFDRFGRDFTLVVFDDAPVAGWTDAAQAMGLALAIVRLQDPAVRTLYAADRVLVRPDHHVAWRGGATAAVTVEAARALLRMATGHDLANLDRASHGDTGAATAAAGAPGTDTTAGEPVLS